MRRLALTFSALALTVGIAGCGIDSVVSQVGPAAPSADGTSRDVRSDGNTQPDTIDSFMTGVLGNVDAYWAKAVDGSGREAPSVHYDWVAPGEAVETACGSPADENAALYCPSDDTIYIGQTFASEVYQGTKSGFPGESAGGQAAGDFAVAYVIAHEYAHNVQAELGVFSGAQGHQAQPFELQADCLAGTWANSAYEQGLLEEGDIEEGLNAAAAVGDFEYGSAQHHGTPEQRRDALLTGYRSGNPSDCSAYVAQL